MPSAISDMGCPGGDMMVVIGFWEDEDEPNLCVRTWPMEPIDLFSLSVIFWSKIAQFC